jgi:radical SAM protein with 4Fe4S-binding SPASM domain
MNKERRTKESIFEQTIMKNIERKSKYIDQVQTYDKLPIFSWIDINVTELCNRRCEFCPRKDPTIYPNQNLHMDLELGNQIANELREYNYKGGVIFSGYSEPLLHPDIQKLVGLFGKDIHTELVTNGDKLNVKVLNELFSGGLGVLLISMYDGPQQIEYFQEMLLKADIKEEQYVLRDRWYSIEEDYGLKLTNRAGTVKGLYQQSLEQLRPCFYLHYSMQIDWNGDVMLCVQDFNKKIKFGSVYAESLLDIWNSPNMGKYRKSLLKGYRTIFPCNNCNVDGTLHGKNHAKIWKSFYKDEK